MLYLSLGENCLSDDVLRRHGLKSFSTPYSHGRTNIDYALALEAHSYEGLVNPEFLQVGDAWGKRVIRSSRYCQDDGLFEASCSKGFEFTHHDPLQNEEDRQSYERKVARLQSIRGNDDVCFLYHHRITARSDLARLRTKLKLFADLYTSDRAGCTVVLYYQAVFSDAQLRAVECRAHEPGFMEFCFSTVFPWGGANPDHLWARVDDDLIQKMIKQVSQAFTIATAAPVTSLTDGLDKAGYAPLANCSA